MEIGGTARQSVLMEVRTSRRRYLARGSCGSTKYWDIRFRFCARELRNRIPTKVRSGSVVRRNCGCGRRIQVCFNLIYTDTLLEG